MNIEPTAKIKVVAPANPKTPGSRAHGYWAKYRNGVTVATVLKTVPKRDLLWNLDKGFIALC